jgi:hypothetical protein
MQQVLPFPFPPPPPSFSPPPFKSPPPPKTKVPFNHIENKNYSILKDNSLISQPNKQVLPPPFPPLLFPPLSPSTPSPSSFSSPLSPVMQEPILLPPRIPIPFSPTEGLKTYILKPRPLRTLENQKIFTQEKKDETDEPDDLYDPDINENNFNILYENPEKARYVIHNMFPNYISYDDEHMWVDSDENNTPKEEESDDDLDDEYDSETSR